MEALLAAGISMAAVAVLFGFYVHGQAKAEVRNETKNIQDMASAIDGTWGLLGSFEGVSGPRVFDDGLAPASLTHSPAGLTHSWGGKVEVRPARVMRGNDAFAIDYFELPAKACVPLLANLAPHAWDLQVGGVSVLRDTGGQFDVGQAGQRCVEGTTVSFVFHSGLSSGDAVAAPTLTLPTPSTPPMLPPPGSPPVLTIPPNPGVPDVSPGVPATPGCGSAPPVPHCANPGGSWAMVLHPAPACWQLVGSCPLPSTVPPPSAPVPPPTTLPSPPPSTPGPMCSPPPSIDEDQMLTCGAGRYGHVLEQRVGTYSCPEAWDHPVFEWSAWGPAGNTCQPCPAPSIQADTRWLPASALCPAGAYGRQDWQREERRQRTVSYTCPSPSWVLPPPALGSWSMWSDTGATRDHSGTCAPCPPPTSATESDWQPRSDTCPSGTSGTWTWEERRTRTRATTYTCPAGTLTLPAPAVTAGAWSWTGERRAEVNTCAPDVPSDGCFTVVSESCASETHYDVPSLQDQAFAMCRGRTAGPWTVGTVHHFPQHQIGCYAEIACNAPGFGTCPSALPLRWQTETTWEESSGTQGDRTMYEVMNATLPDSMRSCFTPTPAGPIRTWRAMGWMPGFYDNRAGCECTPAREGLSFEWTQYEYFANARSYRTWCGR